MRNSSQARFPLLIGPALTLAMTCLLVMPALAQTSTTVRITTALDPSVVTIHEGDSVTFVNAHIDRHRMRGQSGPAGFDTGNLDPGEAASITFTATGTYTYLDTRDDTNHEYQGTIIVIAAGTDPVPPDTTPPPGEPGPDPAPTNATVTMAGRVFRPAALTVAAGSTVNFLNDDDRAHTATATDRSWDSGIFDTGGSYQRTFDTAGTYAYFCVIHPDMTATIVVTGTDGGALPPTPPSTPPPSTPPAPPTTPPPTEPGPAPAEPVGSPTSGDVSIIDFGYSPVQVTVSPEGTISWINDGAAPHTVTAYDGSFDSGFLMSGDSFTAAFATAGTYSYYCTLHPDMQGTLIVSAGTTTGDAPPAAPGTAPTPTPPPTTAAPGPATDVSAPPVSQPAAQSGLQMLDNSYSPAMITVPAGTTLRWNNNGALLHTVTARDGSFDSGFTDPGGSFSARFSTPGTFDYYCIIHPGMEGTVVVTDSGGSAPAATSSDGVLDAGVGDFEGTEETSDSITEAVGVEPGTIRVDMADNEFLPPDLTVPPGTTVVWVNSGELPHTVTTRDGNTHSDLVMPAETFSLQLDDEGVFAYYCTLHPGMEGTVTISADAPPLAAAPVDLGTSATPTGATPNAADSPDTLLPVETGLGLSDAIAIAVSASFVLGGWAAAIALVPGKTRVAHHV